MRGGEGGGAKGLPVGNKVITQRWQERCQRIHLMKIQNMQPQVDNKAPRDFPHLRVNRKKAQMEEDRLQEIERQNGILLEKLSKIAQKKGADGMGLEKAGRALQPGEACTLGSLNAASRKTELQRIAAENQAILRRIQQRQAQKSTYDNRQLEEEWAQTLAYRKLASQKPLQPDFEVPEVGPAGRFSEQDLSNTEEASEKPAEEPAAEPAAAE